MKNPMSKVIMPRFYLVFLFMHGIFEMVNISTARSQDHIFKAPPVSSSLLCYSNCATCPFICSPPPPAPPAMPSKSPRHLPLPPISLSPPEPYNFDQPPPLPHINLSPPESNYFDQPPPLPRITFSPPEPYYYDQPPPLPPINFSPPEPYIFDQPAPFLPALPPPPPPYAAWSNNPYAVSPPVPPNYVAGQGPPGTGQQRSFTFPYYYYNISQGCCISFNFAFLFHFIVCLAMFLAV